MEVKIDDTYSIPRILGYNICCIELEHVINTQHIKLALGQPAFAIGRTIGQHCPFCGSKTTERNDNDEVQG